MRPRSCLFVPADPPELRSARIAAERRCARCLVRQSASIFAALTTTAQRVSSDLL